MATLFKMSPRVRPGRDGSSPEVDRRPHVLVIVQNLPVPLDRRVWMECRTLTAAGYAVSVICPKGPGDPSRQVIDGIDIYKYAPAPSTEGLLSYMVEFGYSWLRTAVLSAKVWRRRPFHVMQACNPPDTYWLLARLWKHRGVDFVFDQHDLNPELFRSRFGEPTTPSQRMQFAVLCWLERMTYRTAAMVISTNESYRSIAMHRGERSGEDVVVVRSGPDTARMRPVHTDELGRTDTRKTLAYLGIMGPQDGVEQVLVVMHDLVHRRGRRDVRAVLMGFGDCYEQLRRTCTELDLDHCVTFTGRADLDTIADELSAADIGLCPDLRSPLNDISTMNKTMEYMAYALPSVSFDLVETRVSGGDTVLYVPSGDTAGFADEVERLLDDDDLRCSMGRDARRRVSGDLDWRAQVEPYLSVFGRLTGWVSRAAEPATSWLAVGARSAATDHRGRRFVELEDDELSTFILERSVA